MTLLFLYLCPKQSTRLLFLGGNELIAIFSSFVKLIGETFDLKFLTDLVEEWQEKERGSFPTPIECVIIFWVFALMWKEVCIHVVKVTFYSLLFM